MEFSFTVMAFYGKSALFLWQRQNFKAVKTRKWIFNKPPKKYPNLSIDEKTRQSLFTNIQFDGFFICQKNQNWRKSSWKFVYIVTKQCRTFFNLTDFLPKKNQNSNFKTVSVNSHNLIHSEKLRIDILLWVIQVLFDFSI